MPYFSEFILLQNAQCETCWVSYKDHHKFSVRLKCKLIKFYKKYL